LIFLFDAHFVAPAARDKGCICLAIRLLNTSSVEFRVELCLKVVYEVK